MNLEGWRSLGRYQERRVGAVACVGGGAWGYMDQSRGPASSSGPIWRMEDVCQENQRDRYGTSLLLCQICSWGVGEESRLAALFCLCPVSYIPGFFLTLSSLQTKALPEDF